MINFTSQFGEDIYIYNNYVNVPDSTGVFVELGAMNGYTYSNTKMFEDTLGFSGVLIEPTTQYNELIVNRPNCKCVNLAVNYSNEKSIFIGNGPCGGLDNYMTDEFKNRWHPNNKDGYFVNCSPFKDILHSNNITYIDVLSIDVEGAEEVVLDTMDFNIPVYVIIIELDGHNTDKDNRCRDILIKNGFTFDKRININEFWINKNYERKHQLFDNNKKRINFSNIHEFGHTPFVDLNHPNIYQLHDALNQS